MSNENSTTGLRQFASFLYKYPQIDGHMGVQDNSREIAFGSVKKEFGRLGKKAFTELAQILGLKEYKVDFNKAGPAVSGDVTMIGMFDGEKGIYFSLNRDGSDNGLLYRTVKSMKDYSGGYNNWMPVKFLSEPERVKELVFRIVKPNVPGSLKPVKEMIYRIPKPDEVITDKGVVIVDRDEKQTPPTASTKSSKAVNEIIKMANQVSKETTKTPDQEKTDAELVERFKAARELEDLYERISKGQEIERLPELMLKMKQPGMKKEMKGVELNELILSEGFRKNLDTNIWKLIPEEFKKVKIPKAVDWKAEPTNEGLIGILKDFPVSDELRPVFAGAMFDKQGIVATDAHKLIYLDAAYKGKKGIYCVTKDCFKHYPSKGEPVQPAHGKFPDYISLVQEAPKYTITVELADLYFYASVLINAGLASKAQLNFKFTYTDRNILGIDPYLLRDCCEAFLKLGYTEADFGFRAFNRAIIICPVGQMSLVPQHKSTFMILMPRLISYDDKEKVTKVDELVKGDLYYDFVTTEVSTKGIGHPADLYGNDNPPIKVNLSTNDDSDRIGPLNEHIEDYANVSAYNEISDAKYAWDMTPREYMQFKALQRDGSPLHTNPKDGAEHERIVAWAVKNGKDVAKEVLQSYPQFRSKPGVAVSADLNKNPLIGDSWFKQHPETILGQEYETTDKFNKPVRRVRGTVDDVLKGIASAGGKYESVTTSKQSAQNIQHMMKDSEKRRNIEKVLTSTKKEYAEKALRKLSSDTQVISIQKLQEQRYSFDDIIRDYNKGISEDEIRAWLWFKRINKGFNDERVILNPKSGWSKYIVPLGEAERYLKDWLKKGVVCYYDGAFMPSVLYYAENIYLRQSVLLREKNIIVGKFGQAQFDKQWNGLEAVKPPRLTLNDPRKDERLFIKPDSGFSKGIKIRELADGTTFSKKKGGHIVESETSLTDAFKEWIEKQPQDTFKKSTSWDILNYYLRRGTPGRKFDKEEKLRLIQNAKQEGDRLFAEFLADAISREDQVAIEQQWNSKYNGYVEINYFKVPVAFTCSATFKNKPLFIRKEQREGLGFINVHGSGCVAYDVGLGKTMTGILALAQAMEMGQCKRPLIVVPNQTYHNWLKEIRGVVENNQVTLTGLLPQYTVNDLYNLGTDYIDQVRDKNGSIRQVPEYSITVLTYEGFNRLSFGEETWEMLGNELYDILNQGTEKKREQQLLFERIEEMMGKGVKGGMVNIEDLGFDYSIVDEAHSMKKSFTQVKGEQKGGENEGRERSPYKIQSGSSSMIALRGFMISQYILRNNRMRNVVLLTATPFTNSPLEIYSMLALIGYQQLEKSGIKNIKDFFDTFIKTSLELVINAKLKPQRREIVMGFHNLIALQQLIFRFITYKTGEEAGIQRPNKIVLPLMNTMEDGNLVPLPPSQQISTNLPLTQTQKNFMQDVEDYVMGRVDLNHFCVNPHGAEDKEEGDEDQEGEMLAENNMDEEEKEGTRILRGLSFARQLALSPYLYACNPDKEPTHKQYIETSPKLKYVMECIESVKTYHEERGEEVSGQVIYMNAGVHFFPLIKEYLVREIGYTDEEVGIIRSGMSVAKKEGIKERFLAGQVKIIIGSATIKEGINLQERASTLYNCWEDWNPTDAKQLDGRIWRYGNIYANVRVVHPLMENSIDTFTFQKREEKTSRINEIWYRAGRTNTLNLAELNPAEIKMGLVTDPHALAELILLEDRERLQDEITSLQNQTQVLTDIAAQRDVFNKNMPHISKVVEDYRPAEGKSRNTETLFRIFKDYLEDDYSGHSYEDEAIYDKVRKAYSSVKRGQEQILTPRGLDLNFDVKALTKMMEKEIDTKTNHKVATTGPAAIDKKAQEIISDRIKRGYRQKTVTERVAEFTALNPKVLSEKMVYENSDQAREIRMQQVRKGQALENSSDRLAKVIRLRETIVKIKQRIELVKNLRKSA